MSTSPGASDDPELAKMIALAHCESGRTAQRERAAYHEAGHIIAAWVLEATIFEADIIHRSPILGRAVFGIGGGEGATVERIIASMAGPTTQRRHAPRSHDGGEDDREKIEDRLAALCRTPEAASIVRDHCQREADAIVACNWDAISAVAEALLVHEYLTGDEINTVLDGVMVDRANAAEPARRKAWAGIVARADTYPRNIYDAV